MSDKETYGRTSLLVGEDVSEAFSRARVIIFGVGGVGSWCAEGLVRSGVTRLTLVDPDVVCPSNVNRQLQATTATIGQVKVEALRNRLLEINPEARIEVLRKTFSEENHEEFGLGGYDYIIDAIDSLKDKIALLLRASETPAVLFSSMGAALKMDPTRVRVAEFWNVRGCPLGALLRKKMRKEGHFPKKKFLCVYDEEVLPNRGTAPAEDAYALEDSEEYGAPSRKAVVNGTVAHITAIFGMTLSGLVLNDIYKKTLKA